MIPVSAHEGGSSPVFAGRLEVTVFASLSYEWAGVGVRLFRFSIPRLVAP